MTALELKPCPFCGASASYNVTSDEGQQNDYDTIGCSACPAEMRIILHWADEDGKNKADLLSAWNRRADLAAVQPAQACPECSNTGLRDTGGVYPWGEGIFVACDHDEPQPDPRDEVIKGLVEAATDAAEAIDMAYGSDDDESPHRHSAKLRAALAAAKAVQHG